MPGTGRSRGFGLVRVVGRSMEPTLHHGDVLLVHWGMAPEPGRLAVVRLPGSGVLAVKRVLRREHDGWWVERDNPHEGVDSWSVGSVPDSDALGVTVGRLWPWSLLSRRR